jgi:thymidylate kinase
MERQGDAYRQRLRDGFLAEAARPESRIHVIDADRPIEAVQTEIQQIAAGLLANT